MSSPSSSSSSSSLLVDCGAHVLAQIFKRHPLSAVLGIYSHVCHIWKSAALICFHEKVMALKDKEEDTIDLSAIVNLHGGSVTSILQHLQYKISSKKLKVTATFELEDKKLILITKKNPHLTHLYLYGCRHLTTQGIIAATSLLPLLVYIDFRECPMISKASCTALTSLLSPRGVETVHSFNFYTSPTEDQGPTVEWRRTPALEKNCQILGLNPNNITMYYVKKAYKELSLVYHPDKFNIAREKKEAHFKFIKIEEAYRYFMDMHDEYILSLEKHK